MPLDKDTELCVTARGLSLNAAAADITRGLRLPREPMEERDLLALSVRLRVLLGILEHTAKAELMKMKRDGRSGWVTPYLHLLAAHEVLDTDSTGATGRVPLDASSHALSTATAASQLWAFLARERAGSTQGGVGA
ncbi:MULTISPECIES: hypothetical protein [Streptomyces]|uniref:hypothetical protein n=1 Tax=Streptomyces TaxID=1883 RepID=UPI00345BEC0F